MNLSNVITYGHLSQLADAVGGYDEGTRLLAWLDHYDLVVYVTEESRDESRVAYGPVPVVGGGYVDNVDQLWSVLAELGRLGDEAGAGGYDEEEDDDDDS